MSRINERQRYHIPASQPIGRIEVRKPRRVRFKRRMKPRAWPSNFWFKSALFDRGKVSLKAKFSALMGRCFTPPPPAGADDGIA